MIALLTPGAKGETVRKLAILFFLSISTLCLRADPDPTWLFSVQLNASVQAAPPQITLHWDPDTYVNSSGDPFTFGATNYVIYRKSKDATSWGSPMVTLPASATSWADTSVSVGSTYEYQVVKQAPQARAFGYIYTGIQAPLTESRGKLVLIVATNVTATLEPQLARFQADLVGDGWFVIRHDVSSDDTPSHVRSLIVSDYNADPSQVNAVLLFGHVPVLQSGFMSYDGHDQRAMPADAYYGDMHVTWSTSDNTIPGTVELMVGRVDVSDLPGTLAPGTMPGEVQMLGNYLDKNHNWRFKQFTAPRRALLADRFGLLDGYDVRASSGYRNFAPYVGLGQTEFADVSDTAASANRWISKLANNSYLWAYACGGGQDNSISEMGLHGQYNDVWNTDLVAQDAKAVFFMLEGSWFGNWDRTDNIMRSVLGIHTMGLAVYCIAGHPQYYCQHIALGEPLGYGVRLTMNNSGLYQSTTNLLLRGVYIALMGDPTLRMEPIAPPSNISGGGTNVVDLSWSGSSDANVGYHVYRAAALIGPYTRLTSAPIGDTSFQDTAPVPGGATYMVRAVALTENPSGSYYNPSQGIFLKVDANGVGTNTGDTNSVINAKPTPGSYNGLFYEASGPEPGRAGSITVTLNKKQSYTGKLVLGGHRYSIHGKLAADGTATNSLGKKVNPPVTVRLSAAAEPDKILGTVSSSDWTANILTDRATFNSRTNKTSLAGSYTLHLPGVDGDANQPAGDSWATMKVGVNGVGKMSGLLADNTHFSQSAPISSGGSLPVYLNLYSGKGFLLGWLNFTTNDTEDLNGSLNWTKPPGARGKYYRNGFTNDVTASGSAWHKPSGGSSALTGGTFSVSFSGGNLATPITNSITITGTKASNQGITRMNLSIAAATGKFSGRVLDSSSAKLFPFSGVLIQKQNTGYGLLLGPDQSSRVVIEPPAPVTTNTAAAP